MTCAIRVHLEGDGIWPDLADRRVHHIGNGGVIEIAGLEGGMESGRPSVSIRIDLPDGSIVIAETSMALFLNAAAAFRGRYGGSL